MDRQWLAFLKQALCQILHHAGDHQPGIGQVEALRGCSREIEGFRNHHLAGSAWKVEGNMVAEHTLIIASPTP
jgi:hypothetical protein